MRPHEFDQALAATLDIARIMHRYYSELIKAGFTEKQSLALTISYQQSLLGGIK
jgi:hypothetical protein